MIDVARVLQALNAAGVEYVVIGGLAATAHGSARLTQDLDIVYGRSPENLKRLVAALAPHHPYLRGAPPGLPFLFDAETLRRGLNFTLTTDLGDVDLIGEAVGGGTYDALRPHAIELDLGGVRLPCAGLRTLIQLKRAAGRPKDLEVIAELEALADEKAKP